MRFRPGRRGSHLGGASVPGRLLAPGCSCAASGALPRVRSTLRALDFHAPDCKAEFLGQMFHRLRAAAQKYHLSTLHKYPSSQTNDRPNSREGKFHPGSGQQSNEAPIFIPRYFFQCRLRLGIRKNGAFLLPRDPPNHSTQKFPKFHPVSVFGQLTFLGILLGPAQTVLAGLTFHSGCSPRTR